MQQAIADCAAKAAGIPTIPPGVVTSAEPPTARQARLYSDPAIWRGMACARRRAAAEDRREGLELMADRNDCIAGFYEAVSLLPRVPEPPEHDLAPERFPPAAPRGEEEETKRLSAPRPIPVARDGRGLAGLVQSLFGRRAPQQRA